MAGAMDIRLRVLVSNLAELFQIPRRHSEIQVGA